MKLPFWLAPLAASLTTFAPLLLAAEHPSTVSEVLATHTPATTARTPEAMAKAGAAFLKTLPDARRAEAALPFDSDERAKWTNVPPRGEVGGVRLGDLTKDQLKLACDFLHTVMSTPGYQKCRNIMLADDKLLRDGKPRAGFGAENYWLAVFGDPSATSPWALQLDGHHLAINLTIVGDNLSLSPTFIGTQPHKFPLGAQEIVPMAGEVRDAHAFVATLGEKQQAQAVIAPKRGTMQTAAGKDGFIPKPEGLQCDSLDQAQQQALLKLIAHWVNDLPQKQAAARMVEIGTTLKDTHFSWSGPTAPESDISYMIQGPTLIIEYSCQDLGGKPLDHLHSIYRDPTNEYGQRIVPE